MPPGRHAAGSRCRALSRRLLAFKEHSPTIEVQVRARHQLCREDGYRRVLWYHVCTIEHTIKTIALEETRAFRFGLLWSIAFAGLVRWGMVRNFFERTKKIVCYRY